MNLAPQNRLRQDTVYERGEDEALTWRRLEVLRAIQAQPPGNYLSVIRGASVMLGLSVKQLDNAIRHGRRLFGAKG